MVKKPKRNPSFFKVLVGDFVNKLRIPPAFVKNVCKGNVPTNFALESDSGSSWRVRVQRKEDGFFFCGGWSSFAKDHRLETRDFLLFFLLDSSTFDVIVYDRTACPKDISFATKRPRGRPVVNRRIEETPSKSFASCSKIARGVSRGRRISQVTPDQHPSFEVALKNYQKYYIPVPRSFVEETGLAEETSTVIKDPKGRNWLVNIVSDRNYVRLGEGWSKFRQENEIEVGDTLLLKHIPNTGNSIHVQFISQVGDGNIGRRNKRPNACEINTSPAAKRPRGPPVLNRQIDETPSGNFRRARKGSQKTEFVSEMISEHPSFEVVLKKYQKYNIFVPRSFAEETGLAEETSTVIKDPNGRMWPVKTVMDSRRTNLGGGWSKFLQENEIVVGDTLLLKHIPNTGNSIHVQVINKAGDGDSGKKNKRPNTDQRNTSLAAPKRRRGRPIVNRQIEETPSIKCASSSKIERGVSRGRRISSLLTLHFMSNISIFIFVSLVLMMIRACLGPSTRRTRNVSQKCEFISEVNPEHAFQVVLKKYQKFCVAVPSSFAKEIGLAEKPSTVIKDPKGRIWQLNTMVDSRSVVRLGAGWSKFLRENGIVVGDTLLFEHIPNTGNIIHFRIINKAHRWKWK
ncbi:hypothetical protein REPUB_Repub10bG0151700 [Reevesia pubescens]